MNKEQIPSYLTTKTTKTIKTNQTTQQPQVQRTLDYKCNAPSTSQTSQTS